MTDSRMTSVEVVRWGENNNSATKEESIEEEERRGARNRRSNHILSVITELHGLAKDEVLTAIRQVGPCSHQ